MLLLGARNLKRYHRREETGSHFRRSTAEVAFSEFRNGRRAGYFFLFLDVLMF